MGRFEVSIWNLPLNVVLGACNVAYIFYFLKAVAKIYSCWLRAS